MSKLKSSDTSSDDAQPSQTQDLGVYDVMDALLGAKAAALESLKFKTSLPPEGLGEL